MVVSTDFPPSMAHIEELPPRWQLTSLPVPAQHRRHPLADVLMRGAMEAVPGDSFLEPRGWNAVQPGMLRHGDVKLRLEGGHDRHARHGLLERVNGSEVDGVVRRGSRQKLPQRFHHACIHQKGPAIMRPGVNGFQAMASMRVFAGGNPRDGLAIVAHAFEASSGQHGLGRHLDHLVFDRSRSQVRYQKVHLIPWNCVLMPCRFLAAVAWNGPLMAAQSR